MAFDIDSFLSEPTKKTRFKDKSVESGFSKLDPSLKAVAETIPATVTSTFRTPQENAAVGGVPNSFHTQGKALDYRKGELGDEDRKRLINSGFEIISEDDHDHVEPNKNFVPQKSSFDIDSFLSAPSEPKREDLNKGLFKESPLKETTPLSMKERARLGFGNASGVLDYLNQQGKGAEFRDGELYVNKEGRSVPAEPSVITKDDFSLEKALNNLKSFIMPDASNILDVAVGAYNAKKHFEDLPYDLAEIPSDIVNAGLSSGGAYGGAALGAMSGPAAPFVAPALSTGGGALGGLAAEKIKEKIGGKIGVYKTGGEFFTPETAMSTAMGALGALPTAYQSAKAAKAAASSGAKNLLKTNKIPERLYGQATGLSDTIKENPEVVETLLRENVAPKFGKSISSLEDVAEASKKSIGSKMDQLLDGKSISPDDVVPRLPSASGFSSDFAAGSRESAEETAKKVLDELQERLVKKEMQDLPGGVMKRPSIDDFRQDILKKYTPDEPRKGFIGELINKAKKARNPPATDEDIARLYQQQYPNEGILLPGKQVERTLPIDLKKLNREKQLLANEAARVYESEGVKGTARQKAQKESADVLRRIIEEQEPGIRPLNEAYNIYRELGEGISKATKKDYRKIPLFEDNPFKSKLDILSGLTKGQKARNAARLFRFMNSPTQSTSGKPKLIDFAIMNALLRSSNPTEPDSDF